MATGNTGPISTGLAYLLACPLGRAGSFMIGFSLLRCSAGSSAGWGRQVLAAAALVWLFLERKEKCCCCDLRFHAVFAAPFTFAQQKNYSFQAPLFKFSPGQQFVLFSEGCILSLCSVLFLLAKTCSTEIISEMISGLLAQINTVVSKDMWR